MNMTVSHVFSVYLTNQFDANDAAADDDHLGRDLFEGECASGRHNGLLVNLQQQRAR